MYPFVDRVVIMAIVKTTMYVICSFIVLNILLLYKAKYNATDKTP